MPAHPHTEALGAIQRIYTDLARFDDERRHIESDASAKAAKNAQEFLHALMAGGFPEQVKRDGKTRLEHALGQKPQDILTAMSWVVDSIAKAFKKDKQKAQALFATGEGVKMAGAFHNHNAIIRHQQDEDLRLAKLASKKQREVDSLLSDLKFDEPSSSAEEQSNKLVDRLLDGVTPHEGLQVLEKIKSDWSKVYIDPNQLSLFASRFKPIVLRVAARHLRRATEFPSEQALKTYLHEHPGADPKNHSVKEPGESGGGGETKGPSGKAQSWLAKAGGEVKSFFTDPKTRKESLTKAASKLKEAPGKAGRVAVDAVKKQLGEAKDAFEGVKTAMGGGTMTDVQKTALL